MNFMQHHKVNHMLHFFSIHKYIHKKKITVDCFCLYKKITVDCFCLHKKITVDCFCLDLAAYDSAMSGLSGCKLYTDTQ